MNNLWKKETAHAEYVNLFGSVNDSPVDMYVELLKTNQAQKDNRRSTEWRFKGKDLFRQGNWIEAVKCYNKSLCFAEIGSEHVALAYSNRSACYFHMKLFKDVLVDIELAKSANLPDRLIPKLEQRKNESLRLMSAVKRMDIFKPKLSYKANEHFPCMANVVEMKYSQEFGRHLVAKCDIPVGKTVLVENDIPRIRDEVMVCYTCLRVNTNCVACPNCADVTFCSIDCMNCNQIHNLECGTFFPHLQRDIRIQINTILLAINSFADVDSLMRFVEDALLENPETLPTSLYDSKSKYHFFFKLLTSAPHPSGPTNASKIYKIAMNLPKISGLFDSDRKKRFLMHLVLHHELIINTNACGVDNSKLVGNMFCILNHSCAPNLLGCIYSGHIFCVSGRPIRKGEQLFTKYSGTDDVPSNARKTALKSRWGFDCKCDKCEPTCAPIDRKLITSDPYYKYLVKNKDNLNGSAIIQKKCVEFLNKYGCLAWSSEIESVFEIYGYHLASALV
ncbi:SET domain-containing protein 3-like [Sitodiplosis mosellana]|uniref:SET domain-containing protein 3-like n=1 Tax=Sitodiplosis mosellana TaxID=263140 RepID=UPI002443A299|nr:SET domain-containing protein 3-like [Sitodiplosis mosellana]